MIITVDLKSIQRPLLSFSVPSSSICKRIFSTSGDAFSTSSNSTTEYGFLRTASVSVPPSSYPTYHAGDHTSLDTLCFSINSDISTLMRAFSSPKYSFARSFARYVFPTPDGPIKKNDAIGLFFGITDNLLRFIA